MKKSDIEERLAICTWSLQSTSPEQLVETLSGMKAKAVQLALSPIQLNPGVWAKTEELLKEAGIQIVSGMFETVGEDYSSLESIKETGGIVPDSTWDQNWTNIQQVVELAKKLGLTLLTFHAGFLPHEESDPAYQKLSSRISKIADICESAGIHLGFETGQETAETLKVFLAQLGRKNVGVNFDPANMILYDKGDPIDALKTLSPWLKQCHIKDANRTLTTGTWGEEVTVGTGQVNWNDFLETLDALNYTGPMAIEREAGEQRVADIQTAREFITALAND